MHIAFVTSETLPFSKTGGLGDVSGSLPPALAELGYEVSVFTPYYRAARKTDPKALKVAEGAVPIGTELVPWTLHRSDAVKGGAAFYLVGNDAYFDRDGLYGTAQGDYQDSSSRFTFFCRAVLAGAQALGKPVDVYHCNDWQSGLVAVYLKLSYPSHPFHSGAASLFTIHNLSYQGLFWHWDWPLLNLPWRHFNWKELEFYGKVNLLKGALVHADVLSTVSPTYAREIQTAEFGYGLEGVLAERAQDLHGVVNGIDTRAWDPARDPLLPAPYSAADLTGKARCKAALLERFELPPGPQPVVGMIGRLVEQKGYDLVAQAFEDLARRDLKLIILGTGHEQYQQQLRRMKELYPDKTAVSFAFDNQLSHLIEAGSDLLLAPSKFEPCGLNQLYALRYGTVPLVRKVGGLADTVTDATPENLASGQATGFVFQEYSPRALLDCLDRALAMYSGDRAAWAALQQHGMGQDWSWARSARAYADLYAKAREKARARSG